MVSISLSRYVAHLGVGLAGEHLAGLGEFGLGGAVRAVRLDHRPQLGHPPTRRRGRLLVSGRVELGELALQLLHLGLEVRESVEHAVQGTGTPARPAQAMTPGWGVKSRPTSGSASTPSQSCSAVAYSERKSVVATRLPWSSSCVSDGGAP